MGSEAVARNAHPAFHQDAGAAAHEGFGDLPLAPHQRGLGAHAQGARGVAEAHRAARTAASRGALLVNYCPAKELLHEGGKVVGVVVDGVSDAEMFRQMRRSMSIVGFAPEDVHSVLRVVSALLPVERLVAPDLESGVLDQLAVRGWNDASVAAAKIVGFVVTPTTFFSSISCCSSE